MLPLSPHISQNSRVVTLFVRPIIDQSSTNSYENSSDVLDQACQTGCPWAACSTFACSMRPDMTNLNQIIESLKYCQCSRFPSLFASDTYRSLTKPRISSPMIVEVKLAIRGRYVLLFCTENTKFADKNTIFDLKFDLLG